MKNKYCLLLPKASDISSYIRINYHTINSLSNLSQKNKNDEISRNNPKKMLFQLGNHNLIKNNKKDHYLDEDDTKNNENFKIFMSTLLNKEDESEVNLENKNMVNNEESNIRSNQKYLIKKLEEKNINNFDISNINNSITKEEFYYSFRDNKFLNKIKNKSFSKIKNDLTLHKYIFKNNISSVPKRNNRQKIYNISNAYYTNNNELDIHKNNINNKNNFSTLNQILGSFQRDKKEYGVNCKINDFLFDKDKNKKKENTNKKIRNNVDYLNKLTQTFSLKEFDGKMLNELIQIENTEKTKKIKNKNNKNNSFNQIRKYNQSYKIPNIIFHSRNNNIDKKEKENKLKLMTMKEKVILFLKDKAQFNLTEKNTYNNNTEKLDLNNNKNNTNFFNNICNSPKININKEKNLKSILKSFDKNYNKKAKRQIIKLGIDKRSLNTSNHNMDNCNINDINYITSKNFK